MKLEGQVKVVEEVRDKIVNSKLPFFLKKDALAGKHFMLNNGEKSREYCQVYIVRVNGTSIAVKLEFDRRYGKGEVHIRDDKIFKLLTGVKGLEHSLSRLRPFYTRRHRGEFLKSMDQLLGV